MSFSLKTFFSTVLTIFVETIFFLADLLIALFKWIYVKVVNFFKNIVPYFLSRKSQITTTDISAVTLRIKKAIDSGEVSVIRGILEPEETNGFAVSGLFNTATGEFVDQNDISVIEYNELDNETKQKFGDNDLLIIT